MEAAAVATKVEAETRVVRERVVVAVAQHVAVRGHSWAIVHHRSDAAHAGVLEVLTPHW